MFRHRRAAWPLLAALWLLPTAGRSAAPQEPLRRIAFGSCASQEEPQPIWEAVVAAQPSDWSSLYLELRLRDAAQSEECALVICPLNPWHDEDWRSGVFHFRAARSFGYGAAAELCRKRLGTLDSLGMVGRLKLERRGYQAEVSSSSSAEMRAIARICAGTPV